MPSTYSPSLRLELIGAGEQAANWGNTTNYNLGTLLEQAIAGVQSVAVSGASYTLTTGSGVADEARNAVLVLTGTLAASCNVIVPTADKTYTFRNATTGGFSVVVKTAAGSGVTIANGFTQQVYCDATNVVAAGVPFNAATNTITTNVSGNVAAGAGSAAAPSVTFGDADTGIYGPAANELGFSANGTEVLRLSASALSYFSGSNSINLTTDGSIEITRNGGGGYIDIKSAAGEDADVRIFEISNGIGFQTGGNGALATRMVINSTGQILSVGSGTAAAPAYSFSGDDNTGFMNPTADVIGIVTAGALRGTVDSVGNVVFGASTNNVQDQVGAARPLLIQSGSNNTTVGASTNALVVANSDTTANNSSQLNFAAITGASPNQYTSAINAAIHGARTNGQYHAGALVFLVAPGANVAPTERMRVPATGPISLTGDLDVAGNLRFNSGYGSAALAYGVRAWVNFNGTGTVAIRGSGGVTSITDNGTGDYTVNLNFTMPDANYAPNINVSESGVAGGSATEAASIVSLATTSFRFACKYSYSIFSGGATSNRFDPSIVSASVVR